MNLANHILPRVPRPLSTAVTCLLALALLAMAAAPHADARVRVVAKVSPGASAVADVARTSRVNKRVPRSARTMRLNRTSGLGAHIGVSDARQLKKSKSRKTQSSVETAEPESQPLPPGVLFDGGFDNGWEGWHVQALDYRVSLFEDGFSGGAAHFEVHDGDVEPETGSERAEVSGASFEEGQDLYVRDTIRVDSETDSHTEWQLIQQLREHDWCCSPGMAVFLDDDRQLSIGPGDGWEVFWEGPDLQTDRWYDLVYRVKLSQNPREGFVEVWLDGVQQTMENGANRIYGQTIQRPQNYIKAGIYRSESSTGTTAVDHDNVIVGTSYSAVMAAG